MIKLSEIPTRAPEGYEKEDIQRKTERMARRIGDLQHIMFAEKKHSLLVVLQGMDGSRKDGAALKVLWYCSPSGIDGSSLRNPTEEEVAHDFLWRIHKHAPAKGLIQIIIMSQYEDVLILLVHKGIDEEMVSARIIAFNAWE